MSTCATPAGRENRLLNAPELLFRSEPVHPDPPDGRSSRSAVVARTVPRVRSGMGVCGSSGAGRLRADHEELYLPSTELRFNAGQMRRLNDNFVRGYENSDDLPSSSTSLNVEAIVHRIVQRLLCGIGMLDRRFASKFLITAEPMSQSIKLSKSFSYYVRLDVLSEPQIYEDDYEHQVKCVMEEEGSPQGFGKIRIVTNEPEKWADLIDGDGYLRRDKLKLRFVELLATSASRKDLVGRPEDVDESYLCGCPGKVVDAGLLHEILKSPADEHVFFGMGSTGSSAFPDPRDLRIAVVEDAQCVKLRVSVPKTTGDIAIVLMPAVEFRGWPKHTDVLSRIPLTHPDVLIHQRAATTGYYAVPVAPRRASRRGHGRQQTAWQMRLPAAECLYQTHYSERSVVGNIHHFLRTKVPRLRNGDGGVCVASGYALKTLLWFRLEACDRVEDWHHGRVAEHVLSVLDALVAALKARRHRSYFWPGADVVLDAARACRTAVPDDDCQNDAEIVEAYLYGLFEKSMGCHSIVAGQAFQDADADRWHNLESVMLQKWHRVLDAVDPAPHAFRYTRKQVEYIGEVFAGMLATRHCVTSGDSSWSAWRSLTEDKVPWGGDGAADEIGLDAAYLVSAVVEQALAVHEASAAGRKRPPGLATRAADGRHGLRGRRPRLRTAAGDDGPQGAVRRLLRDVRAGAATADIAGDADLVRYVLGRLHEAAALATAGGPTLFSRCWRQDATTRRRDDGLGPPLALFLRRLYDVSRATCWHLDEWRRRHDRDELRSLGAFAKLLCRNAARPTEALLDAVDKEWTWADKLLLAVAEFQDGVDIVCAPSPGHVHRFTVSAPKPERESFASRSLGRAADRRGRYSARADTVSNKFKTVRGMSFSDVNSSPDDDDDNGKKRASETAVVTYARLQHQSPMTATIASNRHRSNHRVLGNIVGALIGLQKYTVLQEMCAALPEDKRGPVLDDIRKMSRQRRRRGRADAARVTASADGPPTGVYRSTCELRADGVPAADGTADLVDCRRTDGGLMAAVRTARRERSVSAAVVYNPAFYDAPVLSGGPSANPSRQPYLSMTPDNGFSLRHRSDGP